LWVRWADSRVDFGYYVNRIMVGRADPAALLRELAAIDPDLAALLEEA
jgi:hypothetical protein